MKLRISQQVRGAVLPRGSTTAALLCGGVHVHSHKRVCTCAVRRQVHASTVRMCMYEGGCM